MTTITLPRATVEQTLEALDEADTFHRNLPDQRARRLAAMTALRTVLAQQDEPAQEPYCYVYEYDTPLGMHRTLYPKEHNGKQPDRAIPLYTAPPKAEPVEPVAWDVTKDGRLIYDHDFTHDVVLRVMGDFENDEQRISYAKQIVDKLNAALAQQAEPVQEPVAWNWMLDGQPYGQAYYGNPPDEDIAERAAIAGRTVRLLYTAPPQRTMVPLTEDDICRATKHHGVSKYTAINIARAIEKASWEKNHG